MKTVTLKGGKTKAGWPQQVFDFLEGYQVFKTPFRRFFNIFSKKEGHLEGFWLFSKKEGFGRFYGKKEGFYFWFYPNSRDNVSAYLVSLNGF